MPWRSMVASASAIFCSGWTVTGSAIMPLSYFFTAATSAAWRSTERLRWMKPRPPICAIAIAVRDSVTVSIGLETSGIRRRMLGVSIVATSQLEGSRSEACGSSNTSSKVSPSRSSEWGIRSLLMQKSPRVSAGLQPCFWMLLIWCSAITQSNKMDPPDQFDRFVDQFARLTKSEEKTLLPLPQPEGAGVGSLRIFLGGDLSRRNFYARAKSAPLTARRSAPSTLQDRAAADRR